MCQLHSSHSTVAGKNTKTSCNLVYHENIRDGTIKLYVSVSREGIAPVPRGMPNRGYTWTHNTEMKHPSVEIKKNIIQGDPKKKAFVLL